MGLTRWVLLEGDRNVLAGLLVAAVFVGLVGAGLSGGLELARPGAVDTVAGGLVPGLFAFLSIVLAINQLVLSQEFGSAAEISQRVQRLKAFRRQVEEAADQTPSPVLPTRFLELLVDAIAAKADHLTGATDEGDAEHAVETFARAVTEEASRARSRLAGTQPGRVSAVLAVLDYPEVDQLHQARRLAADHGDALGAEVDHLEELVELLSLFGVARTHFRTSYTQRVLAQLSRRLLVTGVPAILAAFALSLLPAGLAPTVRVIAASSLLTLTFAPVALLTAYVLRIATVSEHTLAAGPFRSRPA